MGPLPRRSASGNRHDPHRIHCQVAACPLKRAERLPAAFLRPVRVAGPPQARQGRSRRGRISPSSAASTRPTAAKAGPTSGNRATSAGSTRAAQGPQGRLRPAAPLSRGPPEPAAASSSATWTASRSTPTSPAPPSGCTRSIWPGWPSRGTEILREVFFDPETLSPGSPADVTEEATRRFGELADGMRLPTASRPSRPPTSS